MTAIIRVDRQFAAEHIGKALAQLHDVDGLTLRLFPALAEDGSRLAQCPISCDSITENAAMIQDGTGAIYQIGYITRWLQHNNTSPLTNEALPHRDVFCISSLTDVFAAFLRECRERRSQMMKSMLNQHAQAAGNSENALDDLQAAVENLQNYLTEAKSELANWQQYITDLECVASDLHTRVAQCRRMQDQALTRTLLDQVWNILETCSEQILETGPLRGFRNSFCTF